MSVTDYMSACLWDDDYGYYATRSVIGSGGDFITAAEISQVFGEIIGLWSAVVWQDVLGAPSNVQLVEYGPGRGTMMRDALRAARVVPGFTAATTVHLLEMSAVLIEQQRQALDWQEARGADGSGEHDERTARYTCRTLGGEQQNAEDGELLRPCEIHAVSLCDEQGAHR